MITKKVGSFKPIVLLLQLNEVLILLRKIIAKKGIRVCLPIISKNPLSLLPIGDSDRGIVPMPEK